MEISKLRKKYSTWDFSEHTHKTELFKNENGEEIRVDTLRKGNSRYGYVKFVNDSEGLSVFGDFGNWIFCRPFHPSKEGYVSAMYWTEKLGHSSSQDYSKYDAKATEEELKEQINHKLEEYGHTGDELKQIKEWYSDLLGYVDDETEYIYKAFRDSPSEIELDYEDIPYVKELKYHLYIVFDAFNEMCNRIQ